MELRLNSNSLWLSLFFFFFNSPEISVGSNVLTAAGKSLTLAVTLVSENGTFEMGFFTPGQSSYYAGIWYKQISPQTVIWVANRRAPISSPDMDSAQLNIRDGNLVLTTGSGNSIWSTNLTSPWNSVQATLLETGNLVLSDGPYSNATPPLWQSFDYPADTLMPHARLGYNKRTNEKQSLISWRNSADPAPGPYSLEMDPTIEQYVVKWNGIEQYWSSGPWDGRAFKDIPNPMYNFSYVNNVNETYSTYFLNDPSVLSRFTITVTGQIQLFTWSNSGPWQSVFSRPEKQCDVYASCGPFGVCNENSSSVCECLPGFTVKSDKDWRLKDFSGGCARNVKLQCGNASAPKDHFDLTTNMKLPRQPQNVTVRSSEQCESFCLRNCSCTAYAYDSNNGCLIWNDEFLILSKDDRNGSTIRIRLAGAEHGAVQVGNHKSSGKLKAIIPATIAGVILVVCVFFYIYYRHRRNAKHRENESNNQEIQLHEAYDDSDREGMIEEHDEKGIDVPFFSFESILVATNNFSDANKLGRGGFGPVYKGVFQGGREIAVKRLSNESGQGNNEFKNEVILIAKLQHRNLVRLLGYCIKGKEKILLYEYMPNKSLDTWIFDRNLSAQLDWEKRFDIILGIARGLLYLHHDSRLRVIHRDLKTSNILLDEEMNPKISDFGLARIVEGKRTEANTNKVVGTYGYMSPEYALDGLFSTKSDVFSFGVVVLEIVSGQKNSGFYHLDESSNLLGYAWRLWSEERTKDLVDQPLLPLEPNHETEVFKCINVGLLCVQEDPGVRPSMSNVLIMLGSDSMSIPRANQPAFVARARMTSGTSSSTSSSKPYSNNQMTITVQEPR